MKRLILKSLFCATLCSIVALTPCQAEVTGDKKYKSVKKLAQGKNAPRWQQQLKWSAEAYDVVYPELKLLGWREVGGLTNQAEIDQFIKECVNQDKLYGHTIYKQGKIHAYEILPLSQLAQKYDVWKGTTFENLKKACNDGLSDNAKIVELKWQINGKEIIEKIAVTDQHNGQEGIIFSAIKLAVDSRKVPQADWQINDRYRSMSNIDFSKYEKIDDDYWKVHLNRIKTKPIIKGLSLVGYKCVGVVKTEEQKNKLLKKCLDDKAHMMFYDHNSNPRSKISTLGELKQNNSELYEIFMEYAKSSMTSLKLGYDKVVRLQWEYNGEKFETYAFVSSYVLKFTGGVGKIDNKSLYLIFDNVLKTLNATNASLEKNGLGRVFRYSSIIRG